MNLKSKTLFVIAATSLPILASAADAKSDSGLGTLAIILLLVAIFSPLIYAGNKWRTWKLGFDIGTATASEFISALLWTIGSVAWLVGLVFAINYFNS